MKQVPNASPQNSRKVTPFIGTWTGSSTLRHHYYLLKLIDSVQLRSNPHMCYIDNPASAFQNNRGPDSDRVPPKRVWRLQSCWTGRLKSFFPSKWPFALTVFTDSNHRVTVSVVCERFKSVGRWLFFDARKPLNTSCSWQMSLVFLALGLAQISRQRFSDS
jgi:hypothetical protein